jgi:aminoglycoside phosphotransferase (APT) family kinase protein
VAFRPDDPLLAVVSPPRAGRLRELAGIAPDEPITADFAGWSKLVLLTKDRALLFPRNHELVAAFRDEIEALRVVEPAGLAELPRVLAVWDDRTLSPYPFASTTRLPGTVLEAVLGELDAGTLARVAERVGTLAARWHGLDPSTIALRPRRDVARRAALSELLGTSDSPPEPAAFAASLTAELRLDRAAAARAAAAVVRARDMVPVLVHGDIHEGQLLVDPAADFGVTGILDWQTARVDHPFVEFDLGEWGPTIWRRHRPAFPLLRRRYWNAYASARGLADDGAALFEWAWSVSHALRVTRAPAGELDPEVVGSVDEALGRVREATDALPA